RYVGQWKVSDKARAHRFEREGQPVLMLWNPSPTGVERIELNTQAPGVSARTVADETRELRPVEGKVLLEVSHSPLFITGFKKSEVELLGERKAPPSTSKSPTKLGRKGVACAADGVWLSVTPPSSTIRPFFVLDAFNTFSVRIHNDSGKLAQGNVVPELRRKNRVLSAGRLPFQVRPGEIETVVWQTTLPLLPELAGELATLTVRGSAAKEPLAPIELPVRLARGRTIEFLANSYTEGQHLHDGSKSGCSDSIRFGNEFSYKFDLRDCQWAQMRLLVGAHNAQEWHVRLSVDEKTWEEVAAGHTWPSWHTLNLDKYLPRPDEGARTTLFVKVHGNDCQLREVILETEQPVRPKQVQVYQRSPTELIVWDARPELGMGMHQMPDDQIALVRRLGVRFVRHTMYWGAVENTATEGTYDEKQLRQWDDLVARCERQGIILVVVVHSNPPGVSWANRDEGYRRFARFMTDMAKRYPQVRYWELWNEMDVGFTDLFGAGRDEVSLLQRGRLYAEMLKMAYPAIKKANPDSWVLTGGMTDWSEFPRGLYEGGGRDYFDLMNLHTYGVPISWAFSARGQKLRAVMQEFGDGEKPLWNTEFGIDAGNFVGAWGYPHSWSPPQKDDEFFDTEQRKQWEACLRKNEELGLYAKVLPYQFVAGNERDDDRHIKERAQLPPGMTIDDYGFGILRNDGKTARPTYNWLLEERINRAIEQIPSVKTEVRCRPKVKAIPVGYKYRWEGGELIIKDVKVDSAFPTRIILKESGAK
ncbi:MAG: cellulase family glycosylhydrolase, partial [Armatimonadetes bacterium]|nr:cellulase family glycosylhydrolase [Armatimonadota bacterium]